jgi:hypothetical protein
MQTTNPWGVLNGFLMYHLLPPKRFIFILSSVRAGSTLLKALLAEAEGVSHLEEIDFAKYSNNTFDFYRQVYGLNDNHILVLKHPEQPMKPLWPFSPRFKAIVLVRDVYAVVKSMERMYKDRKVKGMTKQQAVEYWYQTYTQILKSVQDCPYPVWTIRYEELVEDPKRITENLFYFIGSPRPGTDQYQKPTEYEWKWGSDDGGAKIKTLKVSDEAMPQDDYELLEMIEKSPKVMGLRRRLGYERFADLFAF